MKNRVISDEQIIEMFFARDEGAIDALCTKYGAYLQTVAANILSDARDIEECKNDACLSLWNSIPPERPTNFRAYAAKVIRNISINRFRERSRQKRVISEYSVSLDELSECVSARTDVESEYDALRLKEVIEAFLLSLPKRQRYIFICRYYCGDPIKRIASSLDVSTSLVFHELSRMREQLKTLLDKEDL